ncbi:hypothetical protein IHV09_08705 [Fictibacillus sp. 23RED33]|uniref:hypothetical protein n=1 Tax=Fictibacillus sp. 23RED33 TaxID=2745879 RepID=UPI0018CE7DA3|nr:hypothetical protein [Fictibacillus sp. 23RED33]MBH0173635.1 hypothetical protein [Fictibacillus sp. 23RED33]
MKIDSSIKYRNLPSRFKKHLNFMDDSKFIVVGFTFILLDFLTVLFLIVPYHPPTLWITVPLMAVINVWAITILFKKTENLLFEPILFIACLGAVSSFCHFVIVQKLFYLVCMFTSPLSFVVSLIVLILFIAQQIRYQVKKFSSVHSDFGKEKLHPKRDFIIIILFSIGYMIFGYFARRNPVLSIFIPLTMYSYLTLFNTYLSVKFFHKYLFMKTNITYVPLPKKIKKQMKKGRKVSL